MSSRLSFMIAAVTAALLVTGCTTGSVTARSVTTSGGTTDAASVHPGINDAYREPDVSQWVERFEREGREIYDQRMAIVAACGVAPGLEIADIGAGTGLFVPLFADAVGPHGTVLAVDIVPEFLTLIEERARSTGHDQVRVVLGGERDVRLPPASIDVAFLCDTYHHFEYPAPMMASIHRALRPGGTLVVVEFEREPGVSSAWVLDHVRAGKETVREELAGFGFEEVEEITGLLRDNYFLRMRRVGR